MTEFEFAVVDPVGAPAQAAVSAYFAELDDRFPDGFDPGDAASADAPRYVGPDGCFMLAVGPGGETAACGGVMRFDDRTAEIKRMWVAPAARGRGLGREMLATLEAWAATSGYERIVLDTNSTLVEAIAMYEGSGYRSIERYNDNPYARRWFEKSLA